MKLLMTLLVRDEEDILDANIEFHLRQGVDHIIATDNRSRDDTRRILRQYERQGVLTYLYEAADDYSQHRWVTRMARLAATEHDADWVINNDADEFWWPAGGPSLKALLEEIPAGVSALAAERVNFLPLAGEFGGARGSGAPFHQTMIIREACSLNALGQPLPPKVCHRGLADIDVGQGNHAVSIAGAVIPALDTGIRILHFPQRTYAQFENKIAMGGRAYANNKELPPAIGGTWRRLYESYLAGELPTYYAAQVPGEEAVRRGLAEGCLVRDTRLRDFFGQTGADIRVARPSGGHARLCRRFQL